MTSRVRRPELVEYIDARLAEHGTKWGYHLAVLPNRKKGLEQRFAAGAMAELRRLKKIMKRGTGRLRPEITRARRVAGHWRRKLEALDRKQAAAETEDAAAEDQAASCPSGCFCLCHDADGDTNTEGGCEDCTSIHEEHVREHRGGRPCRYCR